MSRLRTRAKNIFQGRAEGTNDNDNTSNAAPSENADAPVQYRLAATSPLLHQSLHQRLKSCLFGIKSSKISIGINPNQKLAMYLHWMFRVNFLFLFFVMCAMFFALVVFFAGLIMLAGKMDPKCVRIGGEEVREWVTKRQT